MIVPFHRPSISDQDVDEVTRTLKSGWLTTGEKAATLESMLQDLLGVKHFVALNSGTAALHLGLTALGIKPGDEVITSTFTFAATGEAIIHCGARPILADIDGATLNIAPGDIERKLSGKTKALLPVHIGGLPCDMASIDEIAKRHGLNVLSDSAHALESRYRGSSLASLSDSSAYSFYATKNVTTAEGGGVATDNQEMAERLRTLSLHGLSKTAWTRYSSEGSPFYEIVELGYKCNLPDVLAALGISQLRRLDEHYSRRAAIADIYNNSFAALHSLEVPVQIPDTKHAWHLYTVRLNLEGLTVSRNEFIEELRSLGVYTSVHFMPLHLHPFYRDALGIKDEFPEADRAFERVISLPIYPDLSDAEIEHVISGVKSVSARFSK